MSEDVENEPGCHKSDKYRIFQLMVPQNALNSDGSFNVPLLSNKLGEISSGSGALPGKQAGLQDW